MLNSQKYSLPTSSIFVSLSCGTFAVEGFPHGFDHMLAIDLIQFHPSGLAEDP